MRIAAVSGSLRARSTNAAVLRAAAGVTPAGVEILINDASIGALPHFNPDLDVEGATAPAEVASFRARLIDADAVLLCTPEYAHGVPGALKDALDWLVSVVELIGKPVAIVSVAPTGGAHAQTQLVETLETMSWRVIDEACVRLALGGAQLDERGEVADPAVRERLRAAVAALAAAAATAPA